MSELDEEVEAKWTLLPGEVLLNGKPASTSDVVKAIQEAKDRSIRERLAYERLKRMLKDKDMQEAMVERPQIAYVTLIAFVKGLDTYIATGRDY